MTSESVCVCVGGGLWGVIGASERLKIPVNFESKLCVNSPLEPVVSCFIIVLGIILLTLQSW